MSSDIEMLDLDKIIYQTEWGISNFQQSQDTAALNGYSGGTTNDCMKCGFGIYSLYYIFIIIIFSISEFEWL